MAFGKAGVLAQISFRNLFSSWVNVIIGGVIFVGTFVMVVGGSCVDSLNQSMSRSITGSVSGDIQVYSAKSKDELELFGGMMGEDSELAPILEFAKIQEVLGKVPNVDQVVPMGVKGAMVTSGNTIDNTLERLRRTVDKVRAGDTSPELGAQVESLQQHVRQIVRVLDQNRERIGKLVDDSANDPESIEAIQTASSDAFWADFDADPYSKLEFLENRIAPQLADGDILYIRYMGTDLDKFQQAFDRMEIVDGTPVPKGQRGYLMPKFYYEEGFKLKTARRLDKMKEALEVGKKTIAADPELKRFVNENIAQTHDILLQFDPLKTKQITERLQKALATTETDPDKLLQLLLQTTDENFQERYRIFYDEVAPLLDLYRLKVGDTLSIRAFTRSGYVESVNLKIYGTFQFKGLEKSPLAGATGLMDLMSFRDLYGYLSPEKQAEIQRLKQESGVAAVSREDAEDALFGDSRQIVAEADTGVIDEAEHLDPATLGSRQQQEALLSHVYSQEEIDQGVILNAAVMVKDKEKLEETMEALRVAAEGAGLELKVASWQQSTGMIGQFVSMARMSVYTIVGIIFIVVVVILSNAVMMATLRRVREIGTMRAIGAQRGFVLSMIITETVVLGIAFGLLGAAAGAGLITFIGNVGIPAATEELYFFFAGPRFFPSVSTPNLIAAVFVVLGVSALSTFYPAFLATRVSPLEAMQSED